MSQPKVDWLKRAASSADANVRKISALMEYFYKSTNAAEFKNAIDELESIKVVFNNIIISKCTAPYFMRFETEISGQNVEALLNYDYESLIETGTEEKTDKLIRQLIQLIKAAWINGNTRQRIRIRHDIIELLKYSTQFSEAIKLADM
jgi:hypothetical protein